MMTHRLSNGSGEKVIRKTIFFELNKLYTSRLNPLPFILTVVWFFIFSGSSSAQVQTHNESDKADHTSAIHKKRLGWTIGVAGTTYLTSSYLLYETWYKDYPRRSFHFQNDWGEWNNVDKAGHIFSGYFQSSWTYQVLRWTGLNQKAAIWAGAGTGFLAQTTIEVMDGFSQEWGFSWSDFASNTIGISAFAVQQSLWNEQRILFKTSSSPIDYTARYGDVRFADRARALYGSSYFTSFLKDYNAQTTWVSLNLKSFFPESPFPNWLNIAFGYGAENLFGGYINEGIPLESNNSIERFNQYYLSLDVDLSRIKTKSPFLNTLFDVLNIFKVPFTTLEFTSQGNVKGHLIRF